MSRSVISQIVDHFSNALNGRWRINHKRYWLEYLKTGNLPFIIKDLHAAIQEIVNKPKNRPTGEKLLHFRKRTNFTLKEDKTPSRPEEALERFIIASNEDNFFNQFPIGGGKESIDIVIRHSRDLLEFVELKPWDSGDSPLYALVEGLKNLMEYRVIIERQICEIEHPWKVNVNVLAPREYYRNFLLLDESDSGLNENILRFTGLLEDLAMEFDTSLSIHSLGLTQKRLNRACSLIYDKKQLHGQQIITVTREDSIALLNQSNWAKLVSSNF